MRLLRANVMAASEVAPRAVAEAADGSGRAADMLERTPVQIRREPGNLNVLVEFSNRTFIKGFASGNGRLQHNALQ